MVVEKDLAAVQELVTTVTEFFVNYSFQVLGAFIILILGVILGNWASKLTLKLCRKRNADITLSKFTASIVKGLVVTFATIIALGKFGITIAPFIAAIAAVAFGATYAVAGPLSNYAAGLAIIQGRPFVVGDTISVAGAAGEVEEVQLANTTLVTEDGEKITIPNKHVIGEILINSKAFRIVEGSIGISYGDDPETAIAAIRQALNGFDNVSQAPGPQVGIEQFDASSVNIGYRYWVPTSKYFHTLYAVNLAVYRATRDAGITIPFPQSEVTLKKEP